jgi:hypothetical protein
VFSRRHADPRIQAYCQTLDVARRGREVESRLPSAIQRVEELERILEGSDWRQDEALLEELHTPYRFTFNGFRMKGIREATAHERTAA